MRDQLILLPGWGLGCAALEPLHDALLEQAPYLRLSIEALPSEADPQVWLDELDSRLSQDSWLAGWSLGGMLASELAARRGEACRGLISLASNPCFQQRDDWPEAMSNKAFEDFLSAFVKDPAATFKRFTLLVAQGASDPRTLARQLQVVSLRLDLPGLKAGLQLLGQLDTRAALRRYSGPQLHLFAGNDGLIPPAAASALLEWLPDVEVSLLPNASHGLPLEQPERVAEAILSFIREGDYA